VVFGILNALKLYGRTTDLDRLSVE